MTRFFSFFMLMLFFSKTEAACRASFENGQPTPLFADGVARVLDLQPQCPRDVIEFKAALQNAGLQSLPAMVGNRGFHNPGMGSFSFFETVTGRTPQGLIIQDGEFFFGHFTEKQTNTLKLQKEPANGALMIELIAWDPIKKMFHFYEMIGNGKTGIWFYRGDSADIIADNLFLHREAPGTKPAPFGDRLRCSACHASGGPIMKELLPPHNDWWQAKRPLPLGTSSLTPEVQSLVANVIDAGKFSLSVQKGIRQLDASPTMRALRNAQPLSHKWRALFCENEIQLASDVAPLEQGLPFVKVPTGFSINPRLAPANLFLPKQAYVALLSRYRMKFPETNRNDADHAFLTPVRSFADEIMVDGLLRERSFNEEFMTDVLAVDMERPLFSKARCSLLAALPAAATPGWQQAFIQRLKGLNTATALELVENLVDPQKNLVFHRKKAFELARKNRIESQHGPGAERIFRQLLETRQALFDARISQNPRGQILEPGFRVIFPQGPTERR